MAHPYSLDEAAAKLSISPATLRFWEETFREELQVQHNWRGELEFSNEQLKAMQQIQQMVLTDGQSLAETRQRLKRGESGDPQGLPANHPATEQIAKTNVQPQRDSDSSEPPLTADTTEPRGHRNPDAEPPPPTRGDRYVPPVNTGTTPGATDSHREPVEPLTEVAGSNRKPEEPPKATDSDREPVEHSELADSYREPVKPPVPHLHQDPMELSEATDPNRGPVETPKAADLNPEPIEPPRVPDLNREPVERSERADTSREPVETPEGAVPYQKPVTEDHLLPPEPSVTDSHALDEKLPRVPEESLTPVGTPAPREQPAEVRTVDSELKQEILGLSKEIGDVKQTLADIAADVDYILEENQALQELIARVIEYIEQVVQANSPGSTSKHAADTTSTPSTQPAATVRNLSEVIGVTKKADTADAVAPAGQVASRSVTTRSDPPLFAVQHGGKSFPSTHPAISATFEPAITGGQTHGGTPDKHGRFPSDGEEAEPGRVLNRRDRSVQKHIVHDWAPKELGMKNTRAVRYVS